MTTIKNVVSAMQATLDEQWLEKNPFGQFIVTKPYIMNAFTEKIEAQEERAWWVISRRTASSVTVGAQSLKGFYNSFPTWPRNCKKYNDWEKFKKEHPKMAQLLQIDNPKCGDKIG